MAMVDVIAYSIQSSELFSMSREENGELGQPEIVAEDFGALTLSLDDVDDDNDFLAYSVESDSLLIYRTETVSQSPRGDYTADESISLSDLEILDHALRDRVRRPEFDLDLNGVVDAADRLALVALAEKPIGDANFDGVFDSSDLVQIMKHGGFERSEADATWATGDFDGDGHFSTSDLVLAFKGGAYVR